MTVDDFRAFYDAVHGYPPFDWQEQLMKRVAAEGWPKTIALPTSSGKTSAIDIAVFHLALQAGLAVKERSAALRTFFVIDRRVVVDEAAEHAGKVAAALRDPKNEVVREAAKRLMMYGAEQPLDVSMMRGGMFRDNSWADEPNQPLICVSTVDQAGSRLLFRGYQVGDSSRPVHAGLIGNDSLMIVDEAHLSTAFLDTLGAVGERYMTWAELPPSNPLRLVRMSATIPDADTFRLETTGIERDPWLAARLKAPKPAELREPKKKFEDEMIAAAKELAAGEAVSVVGAIANTIGSARAIFSELRKIKGADAVLLIGRNRPHCAQELWKQYKDRIAAKQDRPAGALLYVVATQTVEVGANIDFDALVTEAAPLDSLRQRFGRLNRLGRASEAKAAIVLRPKGDVVYGAATERAWSFLKKHEPVDFGVLSMNALLETHCQNLAELNSSVSPGPLLFPAHIEFWVQTNPTPAPDPDVAPFLHGAKALDATDVQVVWRGDLKVGEESEWKELLEVAPPVATEALAMPLIAVKRWLKNERQEIADVEGVSLDDGKEEKKGRDQGRHALRWRGPGKSKIVYAKDLRPGDTIVVPTSYHGADKYGWDPEFRETLDIGDEANNAQAKVGLRRPRYRIDQLRGVNLAELMGLIERLQGNEEEDGDASVADRIKDMLPERFEGKLFVDSTKRVITWPLQEATKARNAVRVRMPSEETDEGDESSFIGNRRLLAAHTKGVSTHARRYARGCGLAAELVEDIVLAAELHDLGKCDERFQSWLRGKPFGGDEFLAKSGEQRTRFDDLRIRRLAGYPDGARHEAASVMAACALGALDRAHDRDLVLHLIGAHHGHGRPLYPVWEEAPGYSFVVESGEASAVITSGWELARIDSGWVERFWRLNRKYGYWGLPYLEAILRRADCMQSRAEERRESN